MSARRSFLLGSAAAALLPAPATAAGPGDQEALLATLDERAAEVQSRLRALAAAVPAAGALAASVIGDLDRHAAQRRRLGGRPSSTAEPGTADVSLQGLRDAQEALMLAHADGLPALRDPRAVDTLARHMVDVARHLTVTDLWLAAEER